MQLNLASYLFSISTTFRCCRLVARIFYIEININAFLVVMAELNPNVKLVEASSHMGYFDLSAAHETGHGLIILEAWLCRLKFTSLLSGSVFLYLQIYNQNDTTLAIFLTDGLQWYNQNDTLSCMLLLDRLWALSF